MKDIKLKIDVKNINNYTREFKIDVADITPSLILNCAFPCFISQFFKSSIIKLTHWACELVKPKSRKKITNILFIRFKVNSNIK